MVAVHERKSKEERREEILDAALAVFAERGLETSTEEVARLAGISQPYVFRLFGTKKALLEAAVARCLRRTLERFQLAAEGKRGAEALQAIGEAYGELLRTDRTYLRGQMQAYAAACSDPAIGEVVRNGFGDLVTYVERVSGADEVTVSRFFADGMLMNVLASMDAKNLTEPWAVRLVQGCSKGL